MFATPDLTMRALSPPCFVMRLRNSRIYLFACRSLVYSLTQLMPLLLYCLLARTPYTSHRIFLLATDFVCHNFCIPPILIEAHIVIVLPTQCLIYNVSILLFIMLFNSNGK